MISTQAVAWFLMTEGSLSVACRWREKRTKLISQTEARISNTDHDMIEPLRDWLRVKLIRHDFAERQLKNGPIYIVRIRGNALLAFLRLIKPYLVGVKARVAEQVFAYFAITNRGKTTIAQRFEKWSKVLDIVEALNQLNRKAVISREKHRVHIEEIRAFLEEKRAAAWRRQGKNCIHCGRFFPLPPARMSTAKYCSLPCRYGHVPNPALFEDVAKILEGQP